MSNMKSCKAEYISDQKSIFFQKGKVYNAFIPECNGGEGMLAFYFTEEEMDEGGVYALPANRFKIIED